MTRRSKKPSSDIARRNRVRTVDGTFERAGVRQAHSVELVWPGKYDAHGRRTAIACPGARLLPVDVHAGTVLPLQTDWRNQLVLADNLVALMALSAEYAGKVDLVYIDPPFATGGAFEAVVAVGDAGSEVRLPAYDDRFDGGVGGFLAMLEPRLRLIRELLAPHGSLYLHLDATVGHAVKLLADEIFGSRSFQREIVWRIGWVSGFKTQARNWIRNHDVILFYTRDPRRFTFNKQYVPHPDGYRRRDGSQPRGVGVPVDDVWNANDHELALRGAASLDSIQIKSFSREKTGYATQKNESVLQRIIQASSNPGDLVADVFCGSGTTVAVAERLGRRWIGVDASPLAVHIARRRLLAAPRHTPFMLSTAEATDAGPEPLGVVAQEKKSTAAMLDDADIQAELIGLDTRRVTVRLCRFTATFPAAVRAAASSWSDFVDLWMVEFDGREDAPFRPDEIVVRDAKTRALTLSLAPHTYEGAGPFKLKIRVVDVLGRWFTKSLELKRHRGRLISAMSCRS